jgi:hypothetical protein
LAIRFLRIGLDQLGDQIALLLGIEVAAVDVEAECDLIRIAVVEIPESRGFPPVNAAAWPVGPLFAVPLLQPT